MELEHLDHSSPMEEVCPLWATASLRWLSVAGLEYLLDTTRPHQRRSLRSMPAPRELIRLLLISEAVSPPVTVAWAASALWALGTVALVAWALVSALWALGTVALVAWALVSAALVACTLPRPRPPRRRLQRRPPPPVKILAEA